MESSREIVHRGLPLRPLIGIQPLHGGQFQPERVSFREFSGRQPAFSTPAVVVLGAVIPYAVKNTPAGVIGAALVEVDHFSPFAMRITVVASG